MLERRKAASMRSAMTMEDFDDATIATIAMRGAVVAFAFVF